MSLGVVILICMILLSVADALPALESYFSIKRGYLIYLSFCILVLSLFKIGKEPEFHLNPGSVILVMVLSAAAINAGEKRRLLCLASTLICASMVCLPEFINLPGEAGVLWGAMMSFASLILLKDHLFSALLSVAIAPLLGEAALSGVEYLTQGFAEVSLGVGAAFDAQVFGLTLTLLISALARYRLTAAARRSA